LKRATFDLDLTSLAPWRSVRLWRLGFISISILQFEIVLFLFLFYKRTAAGASDFVAVGLRLSCCAHQRAACGVLDLFLMKERYLSLESNEET
jgi:hypothetical protein